MVDFKSAPTSYDFRALKQVLKMIRKTQLMITFVLVSACGSTSTINLNLQAPENHTFIFIDIRSMDDRQSSNVSSMAGNTIVLGDNDISPRPADLVRTLLHNEAGTMLTGKNILLTKFRIEVADPDGKADKNRLASTVHDPGSMAAAIVLLPFINAFENAKTSKVVTFAAAIQIDGVEVTEEYKASFKWRVTERNINATVTQGLKRLACKAADRCC